MALSNMLREPRREITETLIGAVTTVPLLVGNYFAAVWFEAVSGGKDGCPWPLGMILVPIIVVVLGIICWGLANLTHAVGEAISDWLADRGMDPRPKQRY